jgi:nucleoside triphosphate diphosphatase
VLEEAYEVVDAIERADVDTLREEIGDHIFEGVFVAHIAAENGWFSVADSLQAITAKLIRRHPHVFQPGGQVHDAESKERAPTAEAALERWNSLKEKERADSGRAHTTLGGIPPSLPALLRAFKIGKRAAEVGFDWVRSDDVLAKIEEEIAELRETLEKNPSDAARAEEEMGDLLFAIANFARKLDIEPEAALRKANNKFTGRFEAMERAIGHSGRSMRNMTLDELEGEWRTAKIEQPR